MKSPRKQNNKTGKRILIFSLAYPPFVGGAEVAIREITNRIEPAGVSFDMVTLRFDNRLPKIELVGNVRVYRIGFARKNPTPADLKKFPLHLNKIIFQFLAPLVAMRLHKKNKYDAIWAMMAHSAGVPAAIFKMFQPRVPYALTLQEGDPPEYIERKMRLIWPLFKRAFTSADAIQVISTFLGGWARRMGVKGRLEVIPNGVDIERFSKEYPQEEIKKLRASLGIASDDLALVTTSRLVKKNAIDDVIRALALLPKHVKFLIVGTGPEREQLRAQVTTYGLQDRVFFLGEIAYANIPKYLHASDIFIRPSLSEGMGNSFVEAMVAGIPVIGTQEGGIADFLFDPKLNPDKAPTGRAVGARAPKQIASAVELYMEKPKETQEIIKNARALAHARHDWDTIARDMEEKIFKQL